MNIITETETFQVITDDEVHADAFGIRYSGITPVQAAKINKIHALTKARVRDMSDRVSTGTETQTAQPARRPTSIFEIMSSGGITGGSGRTYSQSEFTHDSEALVAGAKYEIEKIAAKADGLVRSRIVPSFDFAAAFSKPQVAAQDAQAQ